jgi:glycosyltransferase involved in cell wall biosynthesis
LPYSDFTDPFTTSPEHFGGDGRREFDFIFVCRDDPWYEMCKNWSLAIRCFLPLCRTLGLRGLVVGHERFDGQEELGVGLTTCGELPWPTLMHHLARARLLLVTSVNDASPRLLAEALALNTPILVNRAILGGWHYVNTFTGAFFDSEIDVADAARRVLERWTSPREWFRAHHGPHLAGARLARFLAKLDPALGSIREIRLSLRMEEET